MPATETLATTSLVAPIGTSDTVICVASPTGVVKGMGLWVDKELMRVIGPDVVANTGYCFKVRRGSSGTIASAHFGGATVTIGRGDQFYFSDPTGQPPLAVPVSPWINTANGKVWVAQGDDVNGNANRWWQEVTTTYGVGALGVLTTDTNPNPASST